MTACIAHKSDHTADERAPERMFVSFALAVKLDYQQRYKS